MKSEKKNTFVVKSFHKSQKNRAQIVNKTLTDRRHFEYNIKGRKHYFYSRLSDLASQAVIFLVYDFRVRIIKYYHVNRCNRKDCEYCCFHQGLHLIHAEENRRVNKSFDRILFYCRVQEEIFVKTRKVLHRLAALEKHRIILEKKL